MSPTRRTLLRTGGLALLGAVTGCTARNGDGGENDSTDDPTPSEEPLPDGDNGSDGTRPEGTGGPGLSLRSVDDAPDLPVVPSVEVTEDSATADHPPQVKVTVTNDSDGTVRVGETRDVTFAYVHDTSGDLVFLPAEGEYPADAGCWRLNEGIAVTQEYRTVELGAGESVSGKRDLYGAADGEGCLPVGEFRFESRYSVTTNTDELPTEGQQATWGFSVALE